MTAQEALAHEMVLAQFRMRRILNARGEPYFAYAQTGSCGPFMATTTSYSLPVYSADGNVSFAPISRTVYQAPRLVVRDAEPCQASKHAQGMTRGYEWRGPVGRHPGYVCEVTA